MYGAWQSSQFFQICETCWKFDWIDKQSKSTISWRQGKTAQTLFVSIWRAYQVKGYGSRRYVRCIHQRIEIFLSSQCTGYSSCFKCVWFNYISVLLFLKSGFVQLIEVELYHESAVRMITYSYPDTERFAGDVFCFCTCPTRMYHAFC